MGKKDINCPHCGNVIEVFDEWEGLELECPVCKRTFHYSPQYHAGNRSFYDAIADGCHPGAQQDTEPATMFTALSKYAEFSGRASRREYWLFTIFQNLLQFAIFITAGISSSFIGMIAAVSLYGVVILFMLIPGLAVTVRRCHDTGRSGWWILISLIPFVGPLILLVTLCSASQPGSNQYGDNPNGNHPDEIWPVVVGILLSIFSTAIFQIIA